MKKTLTPSAPDNNTKNVILEFSTGPGVAGEQSKHVTEAVNAFESVGLHETSNGIVSTVSGALPEVTTALANAILLAFDNGATHFRVVIKDNVNQTLSDEARRYVKGIEHVVNSLGAKIVSTSEALPQDTPLEWENQIVAAVRRVPEKPNEQTPENELSLFQKVEEHFGSLDTLSRQDRLQVFAWLEQRNAFRIRKSVDSLAIRMKISRATAYNYLKQIRDEKVK